MIVSKKIVSKIIDELMDNLAGRSTSLFCSECHEIICKCHLCPVCHQDKEISSPRKLGECFCSLRDEKRNLKEAERKLKLMITNKNHVYHNWYEIEHFKNLKQ